MLEWALLIGLSINDPEATEIARFASEKECQHAAMVIWLYGDKAAQKRGKSEPADVYGFCKDQHNADSRPTSAINE